MKKAIYILMALMVIAWAQDTYGQIKLVRGRRVEYIQRQKGTMNEVLSKNNTIREARSMFSGYSVKDDKEAIRKKLDKAGKK
ncbi:MAG: hypothetical protein KKG84_05190 [Candidatus Omnitrophica bacterium]|nr:hypothetical protein [Candidatus Omnitrophota bacterium]